MQHPRGVTVILGIGIAMGLFVVLLAGVVLYGARQQNSSTNTVANTNTSISDVVKLACTQASDCAAYCGIESTYTPYCDSTKHCTCSYSGEPVPSGNTNTAVTDFVSCAAAGNAVQESYPRKCSVGGVTFTEVLTNSNVNAAKNTNQSTNTNVSTAGWKTYTNDAFGFSFKYPSDYTLKEGDLVLATLTKKDAAMTLSIINKVLEPNNVQGIYGKMETKEENVGAQIGYMYGEGDGGCGGDVIQTALQNSQTLELDFGTCDGAVNTLIGSPTSRRAFLNTFTFSNPSAYWKKFTNTSVGYTIQYPDGWSVKETNTTSATTNQPVRYITVSNPTTKNFVHLGVRKVGNTTLLTDRTGVGAGDFAGSDTAYIADTKVASQFLQYQNKIKEIWYHETDAKFVTVSGYEVLAEFASKASYNNVQLSDGADYFLVNAMLSSLTFTE